MDPDFALLERFADGDEDAFSGLVTRYEKPLYAFVCRMVEDSEDALDLCQKTFVQVLLKAGDLEKKSGFKAWLYKIALNLSQNHLRAKERNPVVPLPDFMTMDDIPPAGQRTALDFIISTEEEKVLRSAIRRLRGKQRIILIMRVYEELSFEEIAATMQCPISTARSNYHHAVSTLRKNLRRYKK